MEKHDYGGVYSKDIPETVEDNKTSLYWHASICRSNNATNPKNTNNW